MLNVVSIQAVDLQDAWFQCLASVTQNGYAYEVTEGSYVGQTRYEFDFVTIQITHPWIEPLLPQIPPTLGIPDPVPGGMEYINEYLSRYLMDGKIAEEETYTYGSRLSGHLYKETKYPDGHPIKIESLSQPGAKVDQIQTVIDILKRGHGTNQATMEVGMPNDCGTTDPPCLRLIDCRVRYGALHFMIYFRSWDLWGGFPANLAGIELLKQYMASEIGVQNGEMVCMSKGLHIYTYAEQLAKIRLGIEEFTVRRE
jgi:thymidylate synthase